MKILFIRHAESEDDITNQYGGWLDLNLTLRGKGQISESAKKIRSLKIDFASIVSSPLKRAYQSAEIISAQLKLNWDTNLYLKEKNGYGLLTGLTKKEALHDHPDLLEDLNNGYVFGSEPEYKFVERVGIAFEQLQDQNRNLIVVTHGGFLERLMVNYLKLDYIKAHDGGFIIWDTELKTVVDGFNFDFK